MTRKNNIIAIALIIAIFFVMMLSVSVIGHNVDHECVGIGCQICQQMESVRQILKMLLSAAMTIAFSLALSYMGCRSIYCYAQRLLQGTLVAHKVELLN